MDEKELAGVDAQLDELYRAIGQYIVTFSKLVYMMRRLASRRISPDNFQLGHLALGEAGARHISNVFFGLCRDATTLDKSEREVESLLRNRSTAAIEERNFVAHGDWLLAVSEDGSQLVDPLLGRFKPTRGDGPIEVKARTARSIDETTSEIRELYEEVADFGIICLGTAPMPTGFRVSDLFRIERVTKKGPGKLMRTGARAAEFPNATTFPRLSF